MSKRRAEPPAAPPDPSILPQGRGAAEAEVEALRRALAASEQERALAADREAHLRAELQHRVRNMLAIIRSISARTFGASDEDDNADHFRGRLDALARAEVRCGKGRKEGCDLEDLVSDELLLFEFDERVKVEGPEVSVPHDVARLLALAVHELATNSIKFGALSSADPRAGLAVRWTFARSRLRLTWEETGVPIVGAAPAEIGFGREYIEQALPYQIDAETSFEIRPGGVACAIEVTFAAKDDGDAWPRTWI